MYAEIVKNSGLSYRSFQQVTMVFPQRFSIAVALFCHSLLFLLIKGDYTGGHRLISLSDYSDGKGFLAHLRVIDDKNTTFGAHIEELELSVRFETDERLRVRITDSRNKRWEIPEWIVPRAGMADLSKLSTSTCRMVEKREELSVGSSTLKFCYTSDPFGFAITRRDTGEVLFNSTPNADIPRMVFKDQYLELTTQLPKDSVLYGLGESTRPDGLRLAHNRVYTLFAMDAASRLLDIGLYGTFPFYLDVRRGVFHGVLLMNSNGMDVLYAGPSLTYRVIGGVFDFYFFAGPSPPSVVDQYTQLVGRPAPMPYWTLGFHQSRYGYKTLTEVEDVVERYAAAEIPLEAMWSDIEYMDRYRDFTVDPVNYPEEKLRAFVNKLHSNGQKYVIIVDPGIAIDENYTTYKRGNDLDIYIRNQYGERYLAQVWPGPVYFPDFFHPNAEKFWTGEIIEFHKRIPFDGLWLDMNEPANFCTGPICVLDPEVTCPGEDHTVCCLRCENEKHNSKWDVPPYKINCVGKYQELNARTIAMGAVHYGGFREYDTHSLFGITQSILTYRALITLSPGKRPFVLARSTFTGSGAVAAHWTGDNGSTFKELRYSIVSCLNTGIFGMPMVGSDICGFENETTEELCSRWVQVGAFYPFARDHADIHWPYQELYLWDSVASVARNVFALRYKLLPHYYTLIWEAHNTGAPLMRPLFFEFPFDEVTLRIDTQFMMGRAILVSPVLDEGEETVNAYFPPGIWYNVFDSSKCIRVHGSSGEFHLLPAPVDTIQAHYRAGFIIPMQEPAMTTTLARKSPFTLLVIFGDGCEESAEGELFLDDGEELEMRVMEGKSTSVRFSAHKTEGGGTLQAVVTAGEFALKHQFVVGTITFLGLFSVPSGVKMNGVWISSKYPISSAHTGIVEVSGLNLPLGVNLELSWYYDQLTTI